MKGIFDYIYYDLWGLERAPSKGDVYYLFTIIDDFSKRSLDFLLEMEQQFKEWKIMIGKLLKCLHIDNRLEFCLNEFISFYK